MFFNIKPNFNKFLLQTPVSTEYDFEVVEGQQLLACGYSDLGKPDVSYVLTYCDPFYVEEVNAFVKSALIDIMLSKQLLESINEQ